MPETPYVVSYEKSVGDEVTSPEPDSLCRLLPDPDSLRRRLRKRKTPLRRPGAGEMQNNQTNLLALTAEEQEAQTTQTGQSHRRRLRNRNQIQLRVHPVEECAIRS